jgi:hypothetical protein
MLRPALLVVLLVATASANKHAESVKRNKFSNPCEGEISPWRECDPEKFDNPVFSEIDRVRNATQLKNILKRENSLESLCSLTETILECYATALEGLSEDCSKNYARQDLTTDNVNKGLALIEEFCTNNYFEKVRRNLDCLVDPELFQDNQFCYYPNLKHDCSQFQGYSTEETRARNECYEVKYRRNCNVDEVASCVAEPVENKCGEEAGELTELAAQKMLEIYPICRDNRFANLLKYFKK